jgi:hypothetical protein
MNEFAMKRASMPYLQGMAAQAYFFLAKLLSAVSSFV